MLPSPGCSDIGIGVFRIGGHYRTGFWMVGNVEYFARTGIFPGRDVAKILLYHF